MPGLCHLGSSCPLTDFTLHIFCKSLQTLECEIWYPLPLGHKKRDFFGVFLGKKPMYTYSHLWSAGVENLLQNPWWYIDLQLWPFLQMWRHNPAYWSIIYKRLKSILNKVEEHYWKLWILQQAGEKIASMLPLCRGNRPEVKIAPCVCVETLPFWTNARLQPYLLLGTIISTLGVLHLLMVQRCRHVGKHQLLFWQLFCFCPIDYIHSISDILLFMIPDWRWNNLLGLQLFFLWKALLQKLTSQYLSSYHSLRSSDLTVT